MVQLGAFVNDDKKPVEVEIVVHKAAENPTTKKPSAPATSSCKTTKPQASKRCILLHELLKFFLALCTVAFFAIVIFMLYGMLFMTWTSIVDYAHGKKGLNATSGEAHSSGQDVASLNITIEFEFPENLTQHTSTDTTSAPNTTTATPASVGTQADVNENSAEMLPELLNNDLAPLSRDHNPFLAMDALMRSLFGLSAASEQRAKQFIQGQGPALMAL